MEFYTTIQLLFHIRNYLLFYILIFFIVYHLKKTKYRGLAHSTKLLFLTINALVSLLICWILAFALDNFFWNAQDPPSHPVSLCHPIARDLLNQYSPSAQKIYSCNVYKFKSSPNIFLVSSGVVDSRGPNHFFAIKDGNNSRLLDNNYFDTFKLQSKLGIVDSIFPMRSWEQVVKTYKEVDWDIIKNSFGNNLIISLNDYKVPKNISSSKNPLTYSVRRIQYLLDGHIFISLSNGELNTSLLRMNIKNYPIDQMNSKYCDWVILRVEKENCLSALGQTLQDINLCQRITKFDDLKNECVKGIARSSHKPDLCYLSTNSFNKDQCLSDIGKSYSDIDTCLQIVEKISRGQCIYKIAEKTLTIDVCNQINITDRRIKNNCIGVVAKATNNQDFCFDIDEDEIKYDCFLNLARSKKKTDICLNIPVTFMKKTLHYENPQSLRDWCLSVSK